MMACDAQKNLQAGERSDHLLGRLEVVEQHYESLVVSPVGEPEVIIEALTALVLCGEYRDRLRVAASFPAAGPEVLRVFAAVEGFLDYVLRRLRVLRRSDRNGKAGLRLYSKLYHCSVKELACELVVGLRRLSESVKQCPLTSPLACRLRAWRDSVECRHRQLAANPGLDNWPWIVEVVRAIAACNVAAEFARIGTLQLNIPERASRPLRPEPSQKTVELMRGACLVRDYEAWKLEIRRITYTGAVAGIDVLDFGKLDAIYYFLNPDCVVECSVVGLRGLIGLVVPPWVVVANPTDMMRVYVVTGDTWSRLRASGRSEALDADAATVSTEEDDWLGRLADAVGTPVPEGRSDCGGPGRPKGGAGTG